MNFGLEVLIYRKENNLDQTEMANKLGVTRQTISNYENNKCKPSTGAYIKFQELKEGN